MKKKGVCINNTDYKDCMTLGKSYDVEIETTEGHDPMYVFLDDNNEPLQTMVDRFKWL